MFDKSKNISTTISSLLFFENKSLKIRYINMILLIIIAIITYQKPTFIKKDVLKSK
jgi:hypothetical protein